MTPKRIRRKKAEKRNAQLPATKQLKLVTPKVKNSVTKKRGVAEVKDDAQTQINKLNKVKLKKDMTEMYNLMKEKGIDGNSGTAGYMVNMVDMKFFIEEAEEKGLTNSQALALFKKKFKDKL